MTPIHASQTSEQVLLGLLTATSDSDRRLLGAQTISFKGLSEAGLKAGVRVLVFRPEDMDDDPGRIWGFIYDRRSRRWQRVVTRLPDVVYNRVPSRSLEQRPDVQQALHRLRRAGVPVFNPGFLDKWNTYRILSNDEIVRRHLPKYRHIDTVDDVYDALQEWNAVFLKPVHGSLGHGIIFVHRLPYGYRYHASVGGAYRKGERPDWESLKPVLRHYMKNRKYIGQVAIRRPLIFGAPFDLRVLVQKDSQGRWKVSGMAARLAARGRVLTHVPRGGTQVDVHRVLGLAFKGNPPADQILSVVAKLSRRAAGVLEKHHREGTYAEFSLDITLDQAGRVWILECNAKPARFDEIAIRRRQLQRVVEFARKIAVQRRRPAQ